MNLLRYDHIFTSESVSEGHPDKIADQISDAVLDACLEQDPLSRVAVETLCTKQLVVIAGEITTNAQIDFNTIARNVIRHIGYTDSDLDFDAEHCRIEVHVHQQSPDISQGVTEGVGLHKEQGAGDQGMMFGFACDETQALMPAPIFYSHKIVAKLAQMRKENPREYGFLRPDAKSQISMKYHHGIPCNISTIVVSHQHSPNATMEQIENAVKFAVQEVIPPEILSKETCYHINPTGRFVVGGPAGDTGLTGRKIIVDTYGGVGSHGGGAFSGKDPSKVDRSAAYMARYIAKNIVKAGLAKRCGIQISYAIGIAKPISIYINTFGTGIFPEDHSLEIIANEFFDMTPAGIIQNLKLLYPTNWKYQTTASYGHFGRDIFPWEDTSKSDELKHFAEKWK